MNRILSSDHIKIKLHADDWMDAIRQAGQVLVSHGSISEKYIDSMISSVRSMGPYIVILPGFALAHAAPCDDVKKNDISLITLDSPILFHCENDPVSIVLCLACTDSKSHIERLSYIAEILMEEGMLERIASANSPEEVEALFMQ